MKSELLKLKYPPLIWLSSIVVLLILVIVFSAHYLDVHNAVSLGRSPWERIYKSGFAIYRIFISVPFVVLFVSTVFYLERQNNGFKQLYALPYSRPKLLLMKLSAILMSMLLIIVVVALGLILCGYSLNFIYPEYEFDYFRIPYITILRSTGSTFIALLGVIGSQYFLSLRFKGFLLPASIGILSYVVSLIFSSVSSTISLYFPYCFPTISRENGILKNTALHIDQNTILNQVELSSIIFFIIAVTVGIMLERRRNL